MVKKVLKSVNLFVNLFNFFMVQFSNIALTSI